MYGRVVCLFIAYYISYIHIQYIEIAIHAMCIQLFIYFYVYVGEWSLSVCP